MDDDTAEATTRPTGRASAGATHGELSGRFELLDRIGKGGMGEVFAATDARVGREVAIKRMRADEPDDIAIERFLREARIQGRLDHPAIVPVHDIGRDSNGLPYFAMKKVAGTTLAKLLSGDAARPRLLRALVEVCLAIEFAHVRGVVHRDLKPDNIVLGDYGEVYVLDWGVAKVIGDADDLVDVASSSRDELATHAGTIVGTPGYMPPEQVRGDPDVDGRADVYALGCVLFEVRARESLKPRGPVALLSSMTRVVDARPSRHAPDVPPELDAICVGATAFDRRARIATARELGERIQRYLDGDRDVQTRQQLARSHLERAREAFSTRGDDARRATMREAAAALALDPALTPAAELVGHLMIEPPDVTPREVEEQLASGDHDVVRNNARLGMYLFGVLLAFVPLLWGVASSGLLAALAVVVVVNIAMFWRFARGHVLPRPWPTIAALVLLATLIAHMSTPFLVAPGFAAVVGMTVVLSGRDPRVADGRLVAALMSAAVVGPWLLELAGVSPTSIRSSPGELAFDLHSVTRATPPPVALLALFTLALIVSGCMLARAIRRRERAAKRQLLVQAWQLRQLVPR